MTHEINKGVSGDPVRSLFGGPGESKSGDNFFRHEACATEGGLDGIFVRIEVSRLGVERQPVVALDQFSGRVPALLECARALWPFPDSANLFPGGRCLLSPEDGEAWRYVEFAVRQVAPVLQRVFGARSFHCIEASFSTVSVPPAALKPPQRVPHFDAVDPDYIAVLHYLTECAGTAFYRQRSTGIERLTAANQADYRRARAAEQGGREGYITNSNVDYEQIGQVAGVVDRVAIYQGALLHSGLITEDPSIHAGRFPGRLTANLFVQIQSR